MLGQQRIWDWQSGLQGVEFHGFRFMTKLFSELRSILPNEQRKEKLKQILNCQMSPIALSEKNAYIEGFKLGVRMANEILADAQ